LELVTTLIVPFCKTHSLKLWLKPLVGTRIMLRDLLTQIACNKKPSLTWYAPEHVDSGKRKMKIAHDHGRSVYQLKKIVIFTS
jgi:hypothetical protein